MDCLPRPERERTVYAFLRLLCNCDIGNNNNKTTTQPPCSRTEFLINTVLRVLEALSAPRGRGRAGAAKFRIQHDSTLCPRPPQPRLLIVGYAPCCSSTCRMEAWQPPRALPERWKEHTPEEDGMLPSRQNRNQAKPSVWHPLVPGSRMASLGPEKTCMAQALRPQPVPPTGPTPSLQKWAWLPGGQGPLANLQSPHCHLTDTRHTNLAGGATWSAATSWEHGAVCLHLGVPPTIRITTTSLHDLQTDPRQGPFGK